MTTGQQIWDLALDYFDDANASFADATQGLRMINTALAEVHEMLARANPDFFRSETTFNLVSGTEAYSLPSDFYIMHGLYYLASAGSNNRRYAVHKWEPLEIDGFKSSPITSGTVEMWYVPKFTELTNLSDNIDTLILPGWEDYASLHVASRLAAKEESTELYQVLTAERNRKSALITGSIAPRDNFIPESVQDFYGRFEPKYRGLFNEERYFKYRIMGDNIYFIEIEHLGV